MRRIAGVVLWQVMTVSTAHSFALWFVLDTYRFATCSLGLLKKPICHLNDPDESGTDHPPAFWCGMMQGLRSRNSRGSELNPTLIAKLLRTRDD
ncbi:hypothetical protein GGS21DRAFT_516001 [Xylaria nigripes]|nr:hypothetical protein GGS21DRAFT_516001 [Xylaria nigripes]